MTDIDKLLVLKQKSIFMTLERGGEEDMGWH